MVKTVPLTKRNTVTNYKGVKMDPPQTIFNCIQGCQLLRAGGFNPPNPPTNTALVDNRKTALYLCRPTCHRIDYVEYMRVSQ